MRKSEASIEISIVGGLGEVENRERRSRIMIGGRWKSAVVGGNMSALD